MDRIEDNLEAISTQFRQIGDECVTRTNAILGLVPETDDPEEPVESCAGIVLIGLNPKTGELLSTSNMTLPAAVDLIYDVFLRMQQALMGEGDDGIIRFPDDVAKGRLH